jgi:hypothetical protein
MNAKKLLLASETRELILQHLVLLEPLNAKNSRFKLEIWTGGYQDMIHSISDLVKVCMVALEAGDSSSHPDVPDPNSNISGVLALILNMLPYEESELLDILYQNCLEKNPEEQNK